MNRLDGVRKEPEERLRADRLARSRFTDHAEDLARVDLEGDVVDGVLAVGAVRQRERQAVELQECGAHGEIAP